MKLARLLFSTEGRIPRSTYWYYILGYIAADFLASFMDAILGTMDKGSGIGLFSGALALVTIFTGVIVAIKRGHDRNHSTKWLLLCSLIPIFNLWVLIELAFLKGTDGDNNYGPDPLHKQVLSKTRVKSKKTAANKS